MPMLDDLLRSGMAPQGDDVNPELEQMLARVNQLQAPQAGPAMKGPVGGMPPVGLPPTAQATPSAPPQGAMSQGMAPEQANVTYQMLIKAGVPPEIAKQAISEPKFLQEILKEMQKRQLGAPPAQPQQPMGQPPAPGVNQQPTRPMV